jgi:hypothetical protein
MPKVPSLADKSIKMGKNIIFTINCHAVKLDDYKLTFSPQKHQQ